MASVSETIARALAPHVGHVFGLMGNGNAYFCDAVVRLGIPFTAVRHEVASVAAADAYHRVGGQLGVATTTYGPGYTNTLTALAEAQQARTPLVYVVGDRPTAGPRPWDIDQVAASAAMGVPTLTVGLDDAGPRTVEALALARDRRGPVVLAIPYDLAAQEVSAVGAQLPELPAAPQLPSIDDATAAELAEALLVAKNPLLLAGRGAKSAGDELQALSDELDAWGATSAPMRGLFSGPRNLGVCGGFAAPGAAEQIRRADLVLVVGAGLNQFTMAMGHAFADGARVVQLDLAEAATHPRVDDFHRTGALEAVRAIRAAVAGRRAEVREKAADDLLARPLGDELAPDGRLDPRSVMHRVNQLLPTERVIATDGGHFIGWPNTYLDSAGPDQVCLLGTAFQSIGLGMQTAVGAAVARPQATTVLVTGDGGGLMSLADAETLVRVAKSCVVVVVNDAAYGAEVFQYVAQGLSDEPVMIPEVDFAALFTAVGAKGVVVRQLADLEVLGEWVADGARGTLVLDCRVSQQVMAPYMAEMRAGVAKPSQPVVDEVEEAAN